MAYKLTAQLIDTPNGQEIVGIERPIPPFSTAPVPFRVDTTVPGTRADISSIVNWDKYGLQKNYLDFDYIFIRDRIKELVEQKAIDICISTETEPSLINQIGDRYFVGVGATGAWAGMDGAIARWNGTSWDFEDTEFLGYTLCSAEEKRVAMQLYMGNPDDHDVEFGVEEAQFYRREYHKTSTPIRNIRLRTAETLIENEIRPYQTVVMLLLTSLVTELDIGFGVQDFSIDMHKNYWMFGIKGTAEDFHPIKNPSPGIGIMDYVYSRALFAGTGLNSMPWIPKNMTMNDLCNRLNEVLVTGVY